MIRIEIVSAHVETNSGKSRKTGNDYTIHKQEGYLHNGHHYPDRFEFQPPLDDHGKPMPYKPGWYTLTPASITVNREFSNLEINRYEMRLLELPAAEAPKK